MLSYLYDVMKKCLNFCVVLASKNDNNSFILLWYNISLVLHTQIRVQSIHKKTNILWLLVRSLALLRFTIGLS
jgi:hypothetical protein